MRIIRKLSMLMLVLSLLLLVVSSSFTTPVFASDPSSSTTYDPFAYDYVPGQILVGMENPLPLDFNTPNGGVFAELFSSLEIISVEDLTDPTIYANEIPNIPLLEYSTERKLPQILFVELAYDDEHYMRNAIEVLESNSLVSDVSLNYIHSISALPNDPGYTSLWGMPKIEAPLAWDYCTGSNSVLVGILDTGIDYNHPDLAANVNTVLGYDFVYNSSDPRDIDSHGTHVSGTVGAVGNNGIGVAGVNWHVTLVPLKVLDDSGRGKDKYLIKALTYAELLGIPILNYSAGGGGYSEKVERAIRSYSGLFIAAAGNGDKNHIGINNDIIPFYPASYGLDNIVAVAASNQSDALSSYSNYGQATVHLAAPGDGILSTMPVNSYGSDNGTSMAAPHVAGAAALLKAYNPSLTTLQIKVLSDALQEAQTTK